ncbi:MAG: helix-hairpin-helix domain-containing protein [candidate division WOR-3 bacterium]
MLGLLLFASVAASPADVRAVRVLFTADLHGRSQPTVDFSSPGLPRRELGGWHGLARVVDSLRTDACLLLDAGDFAFGAPESDSLQGRLAVQMMNRLGYDAAVLGPRDFLGGLENVELLVRAAGFVVLADPMLDVVLKRRVPLFRPFVVKDIKGVRVGIVGITDPDIVRLNRAADVRGLALEPPVVQLKRYLPAVQADSPDVIIALGHLTTTQARVLADSFPELTMVVCAGSDTSTHEHRVYGAGRYGQRVGVVDLLLSPHPAHGGRRRWRVIQSGFLILNVEPGESRLGQRAWERQLCFNPREMVPDSAGRLNLCLLVAEAVRSQTGADIAVLPLSVIESGLRAGPLTWYELFGTVPFRERMRVVSMDDTMLVKLVSSDSLDPETAAPAVAGADYFVSGDTSNWPTVGRIARTRLRARKCGTYRVATTEHWLEQTRSGVTGRLLTEDLTEVWLAWCGRQETLAAPPVVRRYPATPGIMRTTGAGLININTANTELLCTLPGIGPTTARRIIEFREAQGRFRSVDDLQMVKGIGPKKLERIRPLVTVR